MSGFDTAFLLSRKHEMNFSSAGFVWIVLLALWVSGNGTEGQNLRTYNFVAGLAYRLQCNEGYASPNVIVNWTHGLENITGISIRDDMLWFLPADLIHNGSYSCFSREGNDTWTTIFNVSVQNGTCPPRNRESDVKLVQTLNCFLPHVFDLDPQTPVTWSKNCQPLDGPHGPFYPINRSEENVGLFTCFANFTFEGRNYFSAQTTEISYMRTDYVVTRPEIIFPKYETHKVTVGESYKLKCKALVGKNAEDDTQLYWFSETLELDELDESNEKLERQKEGDQEYLQIVLEIPEVKDEHLFKNLTCVVRHQAGLDSGIAVLVPLVPAGQQLLFLWVILGLLPLLALLVGLAFFFRVDLVLAYRDICSRSTACNDGKSYDAYVSYLHGDQLSSSSAVSFALRFLPAVLEDLYGYKLFISGRDELPGEAVHDVVADRMSRSRRLIIVLTSQSHVSDSSVSCKQVQAAYEQLVGLYAALVQQGLKVILVQVEDGVNPALLPESLHYISRTQGILRWRPDCSRSAAARFQKHLRYHMPPLHRRKSSKMTIL